VGVAVSVTDAVLDAEMSDTDAVTLSDIVPDTVALSDIVPDAVTLSDIVPDAVIEAVSDGDAVAVEVGAGTTTLVENSEVHLLSVLDSVAETNLPVAQVPVTITEKLPRPVIGSVLTRLEPIKLSA